MFSAVPPVVHSVPAEALKLNSKELRNFARSAIAKTDAPPHVKTGGTLGGRIWSDAASRS